MKGAHFYADASIPELYAWFADEAAGSSPTWEWLCRFIADDPAASSLRTRLDALPGTKRQPNLYLGALKLLGGPRQPGPEHVAWAEAHWPRLQRIISERSTQTNEAGRCATLLPTLAGLGERLALIEVGMSAGLCLFPDQYAYRWTRDDGSVHSLAPQRRVVEGGRDDELTLSCEVSGDIALPTALPEVVWRGGIDLNPLDPADPDDAAWLEALVWPDQPERQDRLHRALALAAGRPVTRVRGDAVAELPGLVEQAPKDATVVVLHSAVLAYFDRDARQRFADLVGSLGVRWLANEGERVVPGVRDRLRPWDGPPGFVLSLDGEPIARTGSHGQYLHAPA